MSTPQHQYGTSPVSEAASSAGLLSGAELRLVDLRNCPLDGNGLRELPLSFGEEATHLPTSTVTALANPNAASNEEQHILLQPPPVEKFSSTEGKFQELLQNCETHTTMSRAYSRAPDPVAPVAPVAPMSSHMYPSRTEKPFNGTVHNSCMYNEKELIMNPYGHRADEIGLSHHITGIGHLGGLLTPPGWREGDEPIDPQEAWKLFEKARTEAENELGRKTGKMDPLPYENEQQEAEKNLRLGIKLQIHQTLLEERIYVFNRYQKLKEAGMQQARRTQGLAHIQMGGLPDLLGSPPIASLQTSVQPLFPTSELIDMQQAKRELDRPLEAKNYIKGFSYPARNSINPSMLDPSLLPQTLDIVFDAYQAKQDEISRLTQENEEFLASWMDKYGPHLSQRGISPMILPSVTSNRSKPFFNTHGDCASTESENSLSPLLPRPYSFNSPVDEHSEELSSRADISSQKPDNTEDFRCSYLNRKHLPDTSMYGHSENENTKLAPRKYGQKLRLKDDGTNFQEKNSVKSTPKLEKQGGPKSKAPKSIPWYQEDLANAYLPTSDISAEAMQAGFDYKPKKADGNNTKPKRRRCRPEIDPKKGLTISPETAKVLIEKGAAFDRGLNSNYQSSAMNVALHEPSACTSPFDPGLQGGSSPILYNSDQVTIGVSRPGIHGTKNQSNGNLCKRSSRRKINRASHINDIRLAASPKDNCSTTAPSPPRKRSRPSAGIRGDAIEISDHHLSSVPSSIDDYEHKPL